jgi:hypothetical protein
MSALYWPIPRYINLVTLGGRDGVSLGQGVNYSSLELCPVHRHSNIKILFRVIFSYSTLIQHNVWTW